ncbi:MAG: hypothetical protein CMP98_06900 [Gammaproteobacteria bacterium]|nr:hypothetical protein [Gammaproteobacteria bacterium]MCH2568021.1 MaoC family dehydratase N-terminal domain-containing protein [Pseudomonadales bacterium]OUU09664.1 MAG: hypothetical protein CBB94_07060 [Gammaproteobacteria bacterium TMED34]
MDDDIQKLRDEYLNLEFDEVSFDLDGERMAMYGQCCGETDPKFTDVKNEDFQAPPTFVSTLVGGRHLPKDMPVPDGVGMDAGKYVEWMAPLRAGHTLIGKSHLHDIYTKTGRSGRMIFFVTRMELFDGDEHVANADTRTVFRERPSG